MLWGFYDIVYPPEAKIYSNFAESRAWITFAWVVESRQSFAQSIAVLSWFLQTLKRLTTCQKVICKRDLAIFQLRFVSDGFPIPLQTPGVHKEFITAIWCHIRITSPISGVHELMGKITPRAIRICFIMTASKGNIFRVTGHLCGQFTGPRWIPTQRPVTRSFDVFFDLRLNKRLGKQSGGWWFETPSRETPGCSSWFHWDGQWNNYCDVKMGAMASLITSLAILYSTIYSSGDQRKHQSSASLAFVWEVTGDRWYLRTNGL